MTIVQTAEHLDRALRALGPRQASLAAAVRAAGPHPGLDLATSRDGFVTGSLDGVPLASRHQPLAEARRLADRIDLMDHAVVVVHGFGLGHHVAELCRRMGRTGVVIVLEPDCSLLHSALGAIDHAEAIEGSNLLIVTDPADRGSLARHLQDAEWLLGQGVAFLDHPPSRARLEPAIRQFGETLAGVATHARLTVTTTLLRSIDTVRNLTGNLPRYAVAPGVADLAGLQAGRPAILVAAGPSLALALDRLADPRVREHAVIIAAQTTLRPLLERGIRPHFVTALDYHAISTRFYEGLTAADVAGVELVVDPKAHPSILDAFPGPVRCCRAAMLDTLLGDAARDMGTLPPGATVAHLSAYLARHLGCDPIITVGQDLAFTDGLYYGPGAVIHDVWAAELGPFNPITNMEWQRIARHRPHLQRVEAWDGGSVLTDAQMVTYLQQFERDFAADAELGRRVIDATGAGGARKRGAERMDLGAAIDRFTGEPLAPMPPAARHVPDADARRRDGRRAVSRMRADIAAIHEAAMASGDLLDRMLADQDDAGRMNVLFEELARHRAIVGQRMAAFGLIEQLNQLGAFKRVRADRRMTLAADLPPHDRQRAELERDRVNVTWVADAAAELMAQLDLAIQRLGGDGTSRAAGADATRATALAAAKAVPAAAAVVAGAGDDPAATSDADVAIGPVVAVVAIDRADAARLAAPFGSTSLVQATLARLARARRLDEILVVAERGAWAILDLPEQVGERTIRRLTVDAPPIGERGRAVRVARAGAPGAWRGGIAGIGGSDDGLSPAALKAAVEATDAAALVPCGADRPLLDPVAGVDALVDRWREHPDRHRLVFTPLPPGLGAILVRRDLALDLGSAGRLGAAGPMLVHQPHAPQGDPLTTDICVAIDAGARRHVDLIAGTDTARRRLAAAATRLCPSAGAPAILAAVDRHDAEVAAPRPTHLVLELSAGGDIPPWRRVPGAAPRPRVLADTAALVAWLETAGGLDDTLVTLVGDGDPLEHPGWHAIAVAARTAGAAAVHVRTALDVPPATAAALADGPLDIVSVELHASTAAGWRRMHGHDGLDRVMAAIDALVGARRPLDGITGAGAMALPWVVPRMQRRPETLEELEAFHDHWQRVLGTAVLEPAWPGEAAIAAATDAGDARDARPILPMDTPPSVARREAARRLRVLADGSIPRDDRDRTGATAVRRITGGDLASAWSAVQAARRSAAGAADGLLEP